MKKWVKYDPLKQARHVHCSLQMKYAGLVDIKYFPGYY